MSKNKYTHSEETKSKIARAATRRYTNNLVAVGKNFKGTRAILDITRGDLSTYRKIHLVCEICGNLCSTGRSLAVDHDHNTNKFRGLLCAKCNMNYDWFVKNESGINRYRLKG